MSNASSSAAVPNPESASQVQSALPTTSSGLTVPILMYHYIRDYQNVNDPLGIQLSVSPTIFDQQLTTLEQEGYKTITLLDFQQHKYGSKPIILTFDDGYDDHFTDALPILEQHNMVGTFFIIKNFVGRSGYMTAEQIGDLKAAGMEIGAHTLDHPNLATANFAKATEEIKGSLPGTDLVFAYPSGQYTFETLQILATSGVKAAVTTKLGLATDTTPIYELPRIRVKQQTDIVKVIDEQTTLLKMATKPSQPAQN